MLLFLLLFFIYFHALVYAGIALETDGTWERKEFMISLEKVEYLERERERKAGYKCMVMLQYIGWDPYRRKMRVWLVELKTIEVRFECPYKGRTTKFHH